MRFIVTHLLLVCLSLSCLTLLGQVQMIILMMAPKMGGDMVLILISAARCSKNSPWQISNPIQPIPIQLPRVIECEESGLMALKNLSCSKGVTGNKGGGCS